MIYSKAYTVSQKKWCMPIGFFRLEIVLLLFFLIIVPSFCLGQEESQYDEVTVYLNIQGVGGADIPALIKGETAYLSIADVFTILKIRNIPSAHLDSLSGFFINIQDKYLIDRVKNQILFQGKKIELKPDDLILTETTLYMKASLFGEIFGMKCLFSFRDLSVVLTTKLDLPIIRDMKMEQMRENLKRLKGEVKTDSTIGRSYPLLNFGMADWAINTFQQQKMNPTTQLSLSLGSVVAGGEMNVGLVNYNPSSPIESNQKTYLWHYANNDHQVLRQVFIGKITIPQTISSLNGSSLIGIQLSNAPTTYRRSFGTYTLSNTTGPGWLVELYVNNVLVDYVKADASGFYKFEVPLVYGNSVMKVRMYGPWGEVQEKTENTNIPFNFLPSGEFEYAINTGVIEDKPNTRFARTNFNYGVSSRMSIGGGYEYFSSPIIENSLPFIGSSIMLLNNMLLSGEYTFGVKFKSSFSYRLPSNIQFDLNYTGYEKGQKAIPGMLLQERGGSISLPIQGKYFSSYSRFSLIQTITDTAKFTNAVFLFSGNLHGVSANATTSASINSPKNIINTSTNLSLSFRIPSHFTIRPSAIYDYNLQKVTSVGCYLEKPLFGNGYLNFSYIQDLSRKTGSLMMGLRYDFSFMQTELTSIRSKNSNTLTHLARGSFLFDRKSRYVGISNTSMMGRGAFTFVTYLDLNGNGKRDKNEPKVLGLNLRVNGGRIIRSDKDSTIRVIDLTPYTSYLVELDKNSFQSLSWKIKKLTLSVYADPNQFKTVEIPIEVMGEASGTVNVKTKNGIRGQGRVYVGFYREDGTFAGRVLTESDGYFSYMGLTSGNYTARMDSLQLTKIKMIASPEFKLFKVKPSREGDFIEGLDFTLQSTVKDSTEGAVPKSKINKITPPTGRASNIINYAMNTGKKAEDVSTQTGKDRIGKLISNSFVTTKPVSGGSDITDMGSSRNEQYTIEKKQGFSIQMGSYIFDANALAAQRKITEATGIPVVFVEEDGFIKLWIDGFATKKDAERFVRQMAKMGLHPSYIIRDNRDIQILAFE
jgi:hypothetical protein